MRNLLSLLYISGGRKCLGITLLLYKNLHLETTADLLGIPNTHTYCIPITIISADLSLYPVIRSSSPFIKSE